MLENSDRLWYKSEHCWLCVETRTSNRVVFFLLLLLIKVDALLFLYWVLEYIRVPARNHHHHSDQPIADSSSLVSYCYSCPVWRRSSMLSRANVVSTDSLVWEIHRDRRRVEEWSVGIRSNSLWSNVEDGCRCDPTLKKHIELDGRAEDDFTTPFAIVLFTIGDHQLDVSNEFRRIIHISFAIDFLLHRGQIHWILHRERERRVQRSIVWMSGSETNLDDWEIIRCQFFSNRFKKWPTVLVRSQQS